MTTPINIKPIDLLKRFMDRMQHGYSIQKHKPTAKPEGWADIDGHIYEEIVVARCHVCLRTYRLLLAKVVNYTKTGKIGHTYEIRVQGIGDEGRNALLFGFEGEFLNDQVVLPQDWFTRAYKVASERGSISTCKKFDIMK